MAVVAGAVMAMSAYRAHQARQSHPAQGDFATVRGHKVHYVQDGNGPDVLLIHGSMGSTRDMTFRLMPALVARGYRVTAVDRPGLGYTPPLALRGVTIDDQTDILVELSNALNLQKPIVTGQSFGGALAANWAARHPDHLSALVSISGATHPWEGQLDASYRVLSWPVIGRAAATVVNAAMPKSTLNGMVEGVFAPDDAPSDYARYFGPRLNLAPRNLTANAQQRTDLRDHLEAQAPLYPRIHVPTFAIHGDADTIVGISIHSEKLVRDVQDGTLIRLPGAGHMPHHTATDAVADAIDAAALRAGVK